jgi:hypothetical protein
LDERVLDDDDDDGDVVAVVAVVGVVSDDVIKVDDVSERELRDLLLRLEDEELVVSEDMMAVVVVVAVVMTSIGSVDWISGVESGAAAASIP